MIIRNDLGAITWPCIENYTITEAFYNEVKCIYSGYSFEVFTGFEV